jgi:hypothetical protein
MGCLTAPFRALGCLVLVVALILAWFYRDRLVEEGHLLLDRIPARSVSKPAPAAARPGTRSLASARAKIDSLKGWRADSVVLTPGEVASLIGSALAPELRRNLDSLRVELLDGQIRMRARLRTRDLPRDALGPLARALGPSEPIEAAGPLRVTGQREGEWAVQSLRIGDVPSPGPAVPHVVERVLGASRTTVPWTVPAGVRAIRVRPGGATLYGAPPS